MRSRGSIASLALATFASLGVSACVEPAPPYEDWTDAYVPHGPLQPTTSVVALERVTDTAYDEMFQSLSPDGSTLLYVSGWFYADHGIEVVPLVGGDVDADWPSWGSDGWIYFTSNERGDYDVWRVKLGSGGETTRVPADPTEG